MIKHTNNANTGMIYNSSTTDERHPTKTNTNKNDMKIKTDVSGVLFFFDFISQNILEVDHIKTNQKEIVAKVRFNKKALPLLYSCLLK